MKKGSMQKEEMRKWGLQIASSIRPGNGVFICARTGQCYVHRAKLSSQGQRGKGGRKCENAKVILLQQTPMARKGEVMSAKG